MDGVLIVPDEPAIASIDAEPMPDDALTPPEPNDERAGHSASSGGPPGERPTLPDGRGSDGGSETDNRQLTTDNSIEIIPMRVVEAILFASDSPLPPAKIASILGVGDARDVRKHIAALNETYEAAGNAFRIEEIAGGYRMMTLPAYNRWLTKLLRARAETKLTGAAMETLAIVAYKQPCTRADIEAVRGVAAGDILNRLREMNMIKIVGRAEDLGRPLLYGTTKRFLEVFGLAGLDDLPQVDALKGGGSAAPPVQIQPAEAIEQADLIDDALEAIAPSAERSEPDCPQSGGAGGDIAMESTAVANDEVDADQSAGDLDGDASQDNAIQFPQEASADLKTPHGPTEDHPPAKAVVTPRPRRSRKPKDEPPQ